MPSLNADGGSQLLYAGTGPYLVINNDAASVVYLSQSPGVNAADDQLPPQASVVVDGPWYVSTLNQGKVVEVLVFPGAAAWQNPVGVQIALNALGLAKDSSVQQVNTTLGTPAQTADITGVKNEVTTVNTTLGTPAQDATISALPGDIATTGAPPLAFHRLLLNSGVQLVLVGTPYSSGALAFTGTGYDIHINSYAGSLCYVQVTVTWLDSGTGTVVDQQSYWIVPGSATGDHVISGSGPTSGNEVEITVTAFSHASDISILLFQNSRVYTHHDWRSTVLSAYAGGLGNIAASAADENIIAQDNHGLTTGASTTYLLPLYAGKFFISGETTSNTTDATLTIATIAEQTLGSQEIFRAVSDAQGKFAIEAALPRVQCQVTIVNHNAGTQTITFEMTAIDY